MKMIEYDHFICCFYSSQIMLLVMLLVENVWRFVALCFYFALIGGRGTEEDKG